MTKHDPDAAPWELDGALFALGRAQPADIRVAWPIIEKFSKHDEWYLREASFWAIVGLGNAIDGDGFNKLADSFDQARTGGGATDLQDQITSAITTWERREKSSG